jgi:type IX secretion system PorP/SprF family membrane protein
MYLVKFIPILIQYQMKRDLLKFILSFIMLFVVTKIDAQDIHFSQFFETPLLRNPALAGIFSGDVRLQGVYRTQWNSVTVPYQTGSLNGEYKLPVGKSNDFLTIGGQILYDKAGSTALSTTHVLPTVNYHKSLSEEKNSYLSLGFMGGWVQRSINRSKITTNSQYDGTGYNAGLADGETFTKNNYSYLDGSVGMSFNAQIGEKENDNFFIGAAYHHFNKAKKISFYGNPEFEMTPKIVTSLGVRMGLTELSYFTFYADYSKQGLFTETVAGIMYSSKLDDIENPKYILHAGALLRWNDAFVPVAKLDFKPLSVAVSYDANISQLKSGSNGHGGFEVSLTYQKYLDRNNSSKESVRCPKF